jgi:hypothetical protein
MQNFTFPLEMKEPNNCGKHSSMLATKYAVFEGDAKTLTLSQTKS